MKNSMLSLALFLSLIAPSFASDRQTMGGISSGGDDPSRHMTCTVKNTRNEIFLFGVSSDGTFGFAGKQKVNFAKVEEKKILAEKSMRMEGHIDVDFESGELVLKLYGSKTFFKISARPVENGTNFYYSGKFESQDRFFGGIQDQDFTCEMYSQKCAGADCDSGTEI